MEAGISNAVFIPFKRPNEEDLNAMEGKRLCPIDPDIIKKEIKEDEDEPVSCEVAWLKGFGLYSDDMTQSSNNSNAADISLNAFAEAVLDSSTDFHCQVDENASKVFDVDKPFQPSAELVPPQCFGNRKLRFQSAWYTDFPWLHYSPNLKAVLCFTCGKAESMGLLGSSRRRDSVFTVVGFSNWKKAREKFGSHQKSKSHEFATWKLMHALQNQKREAALEQQRKVRQAIPALCLNKLIGAVRFLIHRGHTFQNHESIEESLFELLKFLGQDSDMFKYWLMTNQNFTSPEIQHEIIGLMSHEIIGFITKDVNQGSMYYSVIVDHIQNSELQQLSLCLRYLDSDMHPQEEFIGFLDPIEETGTSPANHILELLDQHSLPIDLLRGIAFEVSSTSTLCYMESCALLKQKQPLAMFVHCGAPCGSYLTKDGCHASPVLQQALYSVNDLCKLFSKTPKFKFFFAEVMPSLISQTRFLCSSKWYVNLAVINTVIQHYGVLIEGLRELQSHTGVSGVRANVLLREFIEGSTLASLLIIRSVMESLNILNMNVEEQDRLMLSTLKKVRLVKEILMRVRQEVSVLDFIRQAEDFVIKLNLLPLSIPQQRLLCPQDMESMKHQVPVSKEEFFKNEYFKVLDAVISQLENRFLQQGFIDYCHLEDVLLSTGKGESDSVIEEKLGILSKYPEFNVRMLKVQLEMFAHKNSYSSLPEAVSLYNSVSPEVKEFFSELGKFLKLLLIIPVSTTVSKQVCCPFQRLKTLLKLTTTETRSNDVAVCYVNETRLDNLCLETIAHNFVHGF
ncbi:52 kDa repressor of the inhibitor of the protein kinase-like [Mixophyes fleayi]|uniref:52 kDa repressor of the inhibitor of the protein kinase-like n=1 Tax=Mixophyes fleayi TaxID=3061075 RepID=UPI003F4DED57